MLIALCQGGRGNSGWKPEADSGLREPTGQEYGTGLLQDIQGMVQDSKLGMYSRVEQDINKGTCSDLIWELAPVRLG